MLRRSGRCLLAFSLLCAPGLAWASEPTLAPPHPLWTLPFIVLLLCIALLPLVPRLSHWWERNGNKLLVSGGLGLLVAAYIALRPGGFAGAAAGLPALEALLHHAVLGDYLPFMVLLFSLYSISGGIRITGDIPARPGVNTLFLGIGGVLASLIGTTGASMVLIRPLLQVNRERRHVVHTVVFFIFIVSNIGGALLPIGDPPLFLGYLRGVPFAWTLHLLPEWGTSLGVLLAFYYLWDRRAWRRERPADLLRDETERQPFRIHGALNFLWLALVVAAVALLVPGHTLPGVGWQVPQQAPVREVVLLALAALSLAATPRRIHAANHFNFTAISEVGALFIGIFLTMQVPIELLKLAGPSLGLETPAQFFWVAGALSSFLDNAPTYVVFFELAGALPPHGPALAGVHTALGQINLRELTAISCGAVFMGANTYIGNGPNFLVKSIAEHHGVKMPSFFGYMLYSGAILIPLFILLTLLFFR